MSELKAELAFRSKQDSFNRIFKIAEIHRMLIARNEFVGLGSNANLRLKIRVRNLAIPNNRNPHEWLGYTCEKKFSGRESSNDQRVGHED